MKQSNGLKAKFSCLDYRVLKLEFYKNTKYCFYLDRARTLVKSA